MTDAYGAYVTPLGETRADEVAAFWKRYAASAGAEDPGPPPVARCFGDTVELADELIALVLAGTKRATAGSMADYEASGEAVPTPGDRWIALDGSMRPRAVLITTDVRVGPMSSVDGEFAWDEGEGDRTRATWLKHHTWFFERRFAELGQDFHPDIELAFERFEVVYSEA